MGTTARLGTGQRQTCAYTAVIRREHHIHWKYCKYSAPLVRPVLPTTYKTKGSHAPSPCFTHLSKVSGEGRISHSCSSLSPISFFLHPSKARHHNQYFL